MYSIVFNTNLHLGDDFDQKLRITGKEDSFAESLQSCLGEMLVLFLLKQKPMYTYEITQEIHRISDGIFTYKSLYPYIYRLKSADCIAEQSQEVAKNRTRIYFHITDRGREHLVNIKKKYRQLTTAADMMLDLDEMIYRVEKNSASKNNPKLFTDTR